MELAGLSVAEAVFQVIPPSSSKGKILIVCGPGNNGGDGLVAARHLVMFGYESVVVYPKQSSKEHFVNLVQQCKDVGIPVLDSMPQDLLTKGKYSALVDSIFGFSFHGTLREPFGTIMTQLKEAQETLKIPAISVDIPSGWNVDGGDEANTGFVPDVLISLTAPKLAAKTFKGRHFIGGRFVPPKLRRKAEPSLERAYCSTHIYIAYYSLFTIFLCRSICETCAARQDCSEGFSAFGR